MFSLRDIFVTATVLLSLPFCIFRPWVGILMWSWLGYMNPHRLSWGFATDLPFALAVAVTTLGGTFFTKEKVFPWAREIALLLTFWVVMLLSTHFAYYPVEAWGQFVKVSKIFLMTVLTVVLVQDREKLKWLLWVIGLSVGFFGVKGAIFGFITGGKNMVLGPEDTFLAMNTEIGLALNMTLPILLLLRRGETRPWVRGFLLAASGLSVVAVLLTYSRGALVGLFSVLFLLYFKGRAKAKALVLLPVAVLLAFMLLPDKWFGRMETMKTYEQDKSAMGRIVAWGVSWRMAIDRPLLGFGFQPYTPEIYRIYAPEQIYHVERSADAHNIFFQVLAEHGFSGLALFCGLIALTLLKLRKIVRRSRDDPSLSTLGTYAQMMEAGICAYVVNGFFLSRSYFDLFYHFVAITVILWRLLEEKRREVGAAATVAEPLGRRVFTPWRREGRGVSRNEGGVSCQ